MTLAPEYAEWIRARIQNVPVMTRSFCGDLTGLEVLDLGCGDMMMDIGLLSLNPAHITGVDVRVRDFSVVEHAAREVSNAGYALPDNYKTCLSYQTYDGSSLPFEDDRFDFVFSWGVFEHISNPRAVLAEARRVVNPSGRIFIVVWPWFHSFHGSHLVKYISEPYFHLHRPDDWVWEQLNEYLESHPEQAEEHLGFWRPEGYTLRSFLREEMWPEYQSLNRYPAPVFTGCVRSRADLRKDRNQHRGSSSGRNGASGMLCRPDYRWDHRSFPPW